MTWAFAEANDTARAYDSDPHGSDAMKKPKLGPKEVVYRNRYQTVYRREADFGTFQKEYFVTDTGERVAVVVEGAQGILMTRQYRHLIDRLSWEVPGGRVDANETLEDAAKRECAEETGIVCQRVTPLIRFHPGLDTYHNPTQVYYSREFDERPEVFSSQQEVSEFAWLPLEQCIEMIAHGEIQDSLSIISILTYKTYVRDR